MLYTWWDTGIMTGEYNFWQQLTEATSVVSRLSGQTSSQAGTR